MMPDEKFAEAVRRIVETDPRYPTPAYEFVRDAVTYTVARLKRTKGTVQERHVSGRELVEGAAEMAVEQFGPLAASVMRDWGFTSGRAIGDVVFNMIDEGLLRASDKDRIEDFDGVMDMEGMLSKPFEYPARRQSPKPPIIA